MPTHSGSCTVTLDRADGGVGSWSGTPTLPASHSAITLGQSTSTLWVTLGAPIAIPSGEFVVGVGFDLTLAKGAGPIVIGKAKIVNASSEVGSDLGGAAWNAGANSLGGASELWGTSFFTNAFDTSFGIAIIGSCVAGPGANLSVDAVTLTVYTSYGGINPLCGKNLAKPLVLKGSIL